MDLDDITIGYDCSQHGFDSSAEKASKHEKQNEDDTDLQDKTQGQETKEGKSTTNEGGDKHVLKGAEHEEKEAPLEAKCIYVLMKKDYRLSRNTRAKWYLKHLGAQQGVMVGGELLERDVSKETEYFPKRFKIKKYEDVSELQNSSEELDAVGVVPYLENGSLGNLESYKASASDWDYDVSHLYEYYVTPRTTVRFLAQRYRFAYLLDMSPSVSGPDFRRKKMKNGDTLASALMPALRSSLTGLARPFYVPGSQLLLKPDLYVSVIAWSPFIADGAQAVLHQGWLLTPANLEEFIEGVFQKLKIMETRISFMAAEAYNTMQADRLEEERIIGGLFEETVHANQPHPINYETSDERGHRENSVVTTASADVGFVNMVRTGMLALQLMPGNSSASIVVVTDGEICAPDLESCDNLLNQLRTKVISVSFLQVSHNYMPHVGLARMPFHDMMEYMAYSTYGAYLHKVPKVNPPDYLYDMNVYHDAFLCWSFRKALQGKNLPDAIPFYYEHIDDYDKEEDADQTTTHHHGDARTLLPVTAPTEEINDSDMSFHNANISELLPRHLCSGASRNGGKYHNVYNGFFTNTNRDRFTLKKFESTVKCSLTTLLSCRLREGFTVNEVLVRSPSPLNNKSKGAQKSVIQVKLSLPWKISTFIHYVITADSPIPSASGSSLPTIHKAEGVDNGIESRIEDYDDEKSGHTSTGDGNTSGWQKNPPSCQVQVYMEGEYDTMQEVIRQTSFDNAWLMEQGIDGNMMNDRTNRKSKSLNGNRARDTFFRGSCGEGSVKGINGPYSPLWAGNGNISINTQQINVGGDIGGGITPFQNKNRLVKKFFRALQQLRYVDKLISHFENFGSTPHHYTLPDVIASGAPLFHIPQHSVSNEPELYSKSHQIASNSKNRYLGPNSSTFQFAAFWRPISSLNINIWHRWLHAHRLHILLHHDHPLPKHLLRPNSSGRFTMVQCRKAQQQLSHALRNWSTFILVNDTTFIRYLWPEDQNFDNFDSEDTEADKAEANDPEIEKRFNDVPKTSRGLGGRVWRSDCPPSSFIIVRLTSKPPSTVVWLAFPGGTCGRLRYKAVQALGSHLKKLKIKQHISWRGESISQGGALTPSHSISSPDITIGKSTVLKDITGCAGDSGGWMETPACIVLEKPIERLLIRYQRTPKDFYNLLEPAFQTGKNWSSQNTQTLSEQEGGGIQFTKILTPQELSFGTYLTLSRYFHCHRWIWSLQATDDDSLCSSQLPITTVNRILTTLIRARLKQGFHFAHSNQGIQTMAIELPTKLNSGKNVANEKTENKISKENLQQHASDLHSCVMQYVIFPPQIIDSSKGRPFASQGIYSSSEEDEILYDDYEKKDSSCRQIQVVTELWVEPQDGIILDSPSTTWKAMRGKQFFDAKAIIRAHDRDIISSLCTHQHLQVACKSTNEEQKEIKDDKGLTNYAKFCKWKEAKLKTLPVFGPQVQNDGGMDKPLLENEFKPLLENEFTSLSNIQSLGEGRDRSKKNPSIMSSSSVRPMHYHFNLTSLLRKSNRIEILLSTFIQNLAPISSNIYQSLVSDVPPSINRLNTNFSSGSNFNEYIDHLNLFDEPLGVDPDDDAANELLYVNFLEHVQLLHDREVTLTDNDNLELLNHFSNDGSDQNRGIRISPLANMMSHGEKVANIINLENESTLPGTPSMAKEQQNFEYEGRAWGGRTSAVINSETKRQSVVSRISSRFTSGASIGSTTSTGEMISLGSSHNPIIVNNLRNITTESVSNTHLNSNISSTGVHPTSNSTQEIHFPRWRSFIKSIKNSSTSPGSNRLLITFLPKSFKDLKKLLLDDLSLSGKDPNSVKIVKTPIHKKANYLTVLKSNTINIGRNDSAVGQSASSSSSNLTTPNSGTDQNAPSACSALFRPKTGSMGEKMDKASAIARKARRAAERLGSKGSKRSGDDSEEKKGVGKGAEIRRRATTTSDMSNAKLSGRLSSGRGVQSAERSMVNSQNLSGTSNNSINEKVIGACGPTNERMRLRTQTHSLVSNEKGGSLHRSPLSPIISTGLISPSIVGTTVTSKVGPISSSSPRPLEKQTRGSTDHNLLSKKNNWGSLSLPIYVFDCTSSSLVTNLVKSSHYDGSDSQVSLTLNALFDKDALDEEISESECTTVNIENLKEKCGENVKQSEKNNDPEKILSFDGDIQKHSNQMQLAYYKSFSKMLFKSLQLDLPIHRFDIQHALDCCDNENIMEIDITKFLLKVCGHANTKKRQHLGQEGLEDSHIENDDASIDNPETATKTLPTQTQQQCAELFENHHVGIKSKFDGLISNSFKLVNLSQDSDLYYYSPSNRCLDDELPEPPPGSMIRKRRSTRDTIGGSSIGTTANGDEDQSLDDVSDLNKIAFSSRIQKLLNDSSSEVGGSRTGGRKVSIS